MSEEEKVETEESEDVEAHRRRALTDEPQEQDQGTDESDDVEAHRRRA